MNIYVCMYMYIYIYLYIYIHIHTYSDIYIYTYSQRFESPAGGAVYDKALHRLLVAVNPDPCQGFL